jgi:hypothetical protein
MLGRSMLDCGKDGAIEVVLVRKWKRCVAYNHSMSVAYSVANKVQDTVC